MGEGQSIEEHLAAAEKVLRESAVEDPRREAEILMQEILEMDPGSFILNRKKILEPSLADLVLTAVRRRAGREPLAYITGRQAFFDSVFIVTPEVLIPRPETEELTAAVLASGIPRGGSVLDLCTGSGCIGLSLVKARPDLRMVLSDISPAALGIARRNAERLVPRSALEFIESDLFAAIDADRRFDRIVSNPPYVHPDEAPGISPEVHREPSLALFAPDPAFVLQAIFDGAAARLLPGGMVAVETSPRFAPAGLSAASARFPKAHIQKDHSGRDRFVIAFR